jgi:hypothetical protein
MNVVITSNEYKLSQVYFTEKKPNTHIANSTFNRITYSTHDFIMNGIYIQFELFVKQIEQNFNTNIYNLYFDPDYEYNERMIEIFNEIETGILNKWVRLEHSSAVETTATTTASSQHYNKLKDMTQQLRSGVISVWKNEMRQCDRSQFQHFIVKISGVWENEGGCGLTYKFI